MLNASYEPMRLVNWQKAMILWFQDKVEVLAHHQEFVRSIRNKFPLPSVIRLKKYIRSQESTKIRFCRENIYTRDSYICQYCQVKFSTRDLTLDHVLPVSQGGRKDWTNIVTACRSCNQKKGNRTPEQADMPLMNQPLEPKWLPAIKFEVNPNTAPDDWVTYLNLELGDDDDS
jgi:5-methylcytosine-specific restriction endonuclease McrA